MANKTYYEKEQIEFLNGHVTNARPLPIKKLKLLQKIFEEFGEDTRKTANMMQEVSQVTREKTAKGEDPEEYYQEKRQELESLGLMTWNDVLVRGSLLALTVWGVQSEDGRTVNVDQDYVEDELDVPTAQRICEVAGNFKLGQLSEDADDIDQGKALTG